MPTTDLNDGSRNTAAALVFAVVLRSGSNTLRMNRFLYVRDENLNHGLVGEVLTHTHY